MKDANGKLDAVLEELSRAHDELYKVSEYKDGDKEVRSVSLHRSDLLTDSEISIKVMFNQKLLIDTNELILIIEYLDKSELIKKENDKYRITFEGKVLIEDGGHVERARHIQIEYDLKEQELRLNSKELFFKSKIFWIALVSLLLSATLAIHELYK